VSAQLPPAGWYPDPSGAPARRYFDGAQWTARCTPGPTLRTPSDVRRHSRNLLEHVAVGLLIALALFAAGGAYVVYERSGTPARVTVTQCQPKIRGYDCTGTWSPAAGPAQTVTVDGAHHGDIGHTLDVHVHSSSRATTNDMGAPAFFFVPGLVCLVGSALTAVLVWRGR
jgi:Protein of unknown function (DUF2510)